MPTVPAWLTALLLAAPLGELTPACASDPATVAGDAPQDYAIVVTGGELLRGLYPDGHTAFLTRLLRPLGLRCVGSICVDDRDADLRAAVTFAATRAPLVIVTGGLGPTDDDITRQTLSAHTGVALHESTELLAQMAQRFGGGIAGLRANLRRQTLVPERGGWLPNPQGTAAGLIFDLGDQVIVALPGPPRELQPMARQELVPFLQSRFGLRTFGSSVTLRFVGIGESLIDETLHHDVALPEGLGISSIFEGGRVDVTFSLAGHATADQARLSALVEAIRAHLGRHIYSTNDDSLEAVVLGRIQAEGGSLLLAECGSGGVLANQLLREPTAEQVLRGACVAPNLAGLHQLLGLAEPFPTVTGDGEHAVEQLCVAAMRDGRPGVVLVTGERTNSASASEIWCALGRRGRVLSTQRFRTSGSGAMAQASLATAILDWVRLGLNGNPEPTDSESGG